MGAREARKTSAADLALLALATAARCTDADQRTELAAYYRSIAPALEPQRAKLAELERTEARPEKADSDHFDHRGGDAAHDPVVAPRELDGRDRWRDVSRLFPRCCRIPSRIEGRLTRADLARWLTSPENPLTARTFVNRMWKLAFGAGLSRKLDDLGAQGEWPSHPHLLDWLAGQFIDSGWNVKHVIKLIVMSGTYRQSSQVTPELREADPDNRWLARQGRFRIDAEMVRDNALKISGLLVERIGGPSVKPYQPPGYWSHLNFPPREWENGSGAELYRRSLYTHWQRQYLHPAMLAFDAPGREECTADRPRSNTPLQSLVLMNDPEFIEAARAFGEQILEHGGTTTAQRLAWAFRRALSRPPRDAGKRRAHKTAGDAPVGISAGSASRPTNWWPSANIPFPVRSITSSWRPGRASAARSSTCTKRSLATETCHDASSSHRPPHVRLEYRRELGLDGAGKHDAANEAAAGGDHGATGERRSPRQTADCAAGQADYLALYGRRHEPSRHVRLQAPAAEARTQADARRRSQRASRSLNCRGRTCSSFRRSTGSANGATRGSRSA